MKNRVAIVSSGAGFFKDDARNGLCVSQAYAAGAGALEWRLTSAMFHESEIEDEFGFAKKKKIWGYTEDSAPSWGRLLEARPASSGWSWVEYSPACFRVENVEGGLERAEVRFASPQTNLQKKDIDLVLEVVGRSVSTVVYDDADEDEYLDSRDIVEIYMELGEDRQIFSEQIEKICAQKSIQVSFR